MRRVFVLQAWVFALLAMLALVMETGDRRWLDPNNPYYAEIQAYRAIDHSDEVVFLGSSVVGRSIIPAEVEQGLREQSIDADVWSLFFVSGIVPTYRTAVRDLILTRGRPRMIVIGLSPRDLNSGADLTDRYAAYMASVGDVARLIPRRPWLRASMVWPLAIRPPRAAMGAVYVPELKRERVAETAARDGAYWAWEPDDPERAARRDPVRDLPDEERFSLRLGHVQSGLENFAIGDFERELTATVELARGAGVEVVLCLYPYSDRGRLALDGGYMDETRSFLEQFAGEHDLPLVDLGAEMPGLSRADQYTDLIDHTTVQTALSLSRHLGSGPIAELLDDAPAPPDHS